MLSDPKIKPRLWNLKTGVVAYNCTRLGLSGPKKGLVLAMPIWERAGKTAYDYSGNAYSGVIGSLSYWSGQGLYCDDYGIEIPASHAPAINGPNTWVFHFKVTGSNHYVLCVDVVNYFINVSTRKLYNGSAWSTAWSTTVIDGKWHTLTVVHDGTDTHIYVDGKFDTTYSSYAFGSFSGRKINIGARSTYGIDDILTVVYLFDVAFSTQQVQTISNNLYGMFEPIKSPAMWSFVSAGGETFYKTVVGALPNPDGTVNTILVYRRSVYGNIPNTIGSIVKDIDKSLVGNQPNTMGNIVRDTGKGLAGNQPSVTASLDTTVVQKKTVSGNVPESNATLSSELVGTQSIFGNIPNVVGVIVKRISKCLAGNQPTSQGSIIKDIGKKLAGDQPAVTGNIKRKITTKKIGVMGTITGVVSSILNPVGPGIVKLYKLIGSSLKKFIG